MSHPAEDKVETDELGGPAIAVGALIRCARAAMDAFAGATQERVDEAVTALAWSLYKPEHAEALARMAVEDTGIGNATDKVVKNQRKTFGTLRDLLRVKSVGIIEELPDLGLVKYAKPVGVVGAVTPSTNPAATPVNKAMMALKGRNAIVIAPSPTGLATTTRTVELMRAELERIGAPANLVQVLPPPVDKASTRALMAACDLVVVTGSQNNVREAYRSGTPAIGVGAGNVPVIVDRSADLDEAAEKIAKSKCFDNATSCSSENSVVIVDDEYYEALAALERAGGYLANTAEKEAIRGTLRVNGKLNRDVIAKDARVFAAACSLRDSSSAASGRTVACHGDVMPGETRRDPRYDVLFEPIAIGPVTAKNRFYQVPHCNGMGYRDPTALAWMRGVKAEGGWAVVCTEEVEIHHTSDIAPYIELRIWDHRDIPALARVADRIHEFDALAGIELAYNGPNGANSYGREVPLAPSAMPVATSDHDPVQARAMTRQDIRDFRRWHRAAALRAREAGFDLVYVYAAHCLSVLHFFLSPLHNRRSDEYGGPPRNRVRLLEEVLTDTREAVGDTCAVACRISTDELLGPNGLEKAEAEEMIGLVAELPDLWDVALAAWENDSQTSRFGPEGRQEPFIEGVKRLTSQPVVGVGRYTSPDRMASVIRKGIADLVGCARPSIADPFLPKKIEEGRFEDIRECIGCNICVSGDFSMSPIRCTQNPTMGEEWRKGWHPERIRPRESDRPVLVVGAGPAGLEAAQSLGKRGYAVTLAEKGTELGGRVARECRLPGLAAWGRVRDYRAQQLHQLPNVEICFDSALDVESVLEFGFPRIVVATGARWRTDGVGRHRKRPLPTVPHARILSPDDVMDGAALPEAGERVVVWDDDHYYMGGVIAELLAERGCDTHYLTPASEASTWTRKTLEQPFIQARLLEKGVTIRSFTALDAVTEGAVTASCVFTGRTEELEADAVVLVTSRTPEDRLAEELAERAADWPDAGIDSVAAIGDALAPATIAHAVYAGRRYAEELDRPPRTNDEVPFRRELPALASLHPD